MTEEQIQQLCDCIPTLRAEYVAACYVLAAATGADDAETWKTWLIAAAKEITGGLPPMTDAALRMIGDESKRLTDDVVDCARRE